MVNLIKFKMVVARVLDGPPPEEEFSGIVFAVGKARGTRKIEDPSSSDQESSDPYSDESCQKLLTSIFYEEDIETFTASIKELKDDPEKLVAVLKYHTEQILENEKTKKIPPKELALHSLLLSARMELALEEVEKVLKINSSEASRCEQGMKIHETENWLERCLLAARTFFSSEEHRTNVEELGELRKNSPFDVNNPSSQSPETKLYFEHFGKIRNFLAGIETRIKSVLQKEQVRSDSNGVIINL